MTSPPPLLSTTVTVPTFIQLLSYISTLPSSLLADVLPTLTANLPSPSSNIAFYREAFLACLTQTPNTAALDGLQLLQFLHPSLLAPPPPPSFFAHISLTPPPLLLSLLTPLLFPLTDESMETLMQAITSLSPEVRQAVSHDVVALVSQLAESVQRDYLIAIITAPQDVKPPPPPPLAPATTVTPTPASPKSLLTLQLATLAPLFPALGAGYLHLALLCYGNSVEDATNALFGDENRLHPRLRGVPTDLPRMKMRENGSYQGVGEGEFKEMQVTALKKIDADAENEAFLRSAFEYGDDYDDQYDEPGMVSGVDAVSSLADMGAMKAYNDMKRGGLEDNKEWEEMRNTNVKGVRSQGDKEKHWEATSKRKNGRGIKKVEAAESSSESEAEEKEGDSKKKGGEGSQQNQRGSQQNQSGSQQNQRGSQQNQLGSQQKSKGGEQKGGEQKGGEKKGGTPGGEKSDSNMTDLQKKRKDKNKASRANHNRKDRALKKQA